MTGIAGLYPTELARVYLILNFLTLRPIHLLLLLLDVLPDRLFLHLEQIDAHVESIGRQEPFLEDIFLSLPGERVPHQLLHSLQLFCLFNASDRLLLGLARLALDLGTPACNRTALD